MPTRKCPPHSQRFLPRRRHSSSTLSILTGEPQSHIGSDSEQLPSRSDVEQGDFFGGTRRAAEEVALEVPARLVLRARLLDGHFLHPVTAAVAVDLFEQRVCRLDGVDLEGPEALGLLE